MELKWKSCLKIGITVIILFLAMHYWTAFTGLARIAFHAAMPLCLGCIIAYIVNILMSFFECHFKIADNTAAAKPECCLSMD